MTIPSNAPSRNSKLRIGFRIVSLVVILAATAFWVSTGSHTGFSKNRVEVPQIDPITQIEYVEYEERFIMGVEYLAVAYALALGLFGVSFIFKRRNS